MVALDGPDCRGELNDGNSEAEHGRDKEREMTLSFELYQN
jgi:hypothetical protein